MQVVLRRLAVACFLIVALALLLAGAALLIGWVPGWLPALAGGAAPAAGAAPLTLGVLLSANALFWFDDRRWADVLLLPGSVALVTALTAHAWLQQPPPLPAMGGVTSLALHWLVAGLLVLPGGVAVVCALLARLLRGQDRPAGITEFYEHAVAARRVRRDAAQEAVVARLEELSAAVLRFNRARRMPWGFLRRPPRGVYLWGPVGRGKSFLMDGFFDVLPSRHKRRYHFHELLADIRRQLHEARGRRNPMRRIVTAIAPRGSVVFIDELQVDDVDNAQVFAELLRLFRRNANTVCLTSNQRPEGLFGTSAAARERFGDMLPLLRASMDVLALDRGQDYRELKLAAHDLYQSPIDAHTEGGMQRVFDMLVEGAISTDPIEVHQRRFRPRAHGPGVVWFEFAEICRQPRSYVDFMHLVRGYPNVMVSNVPAFGEDDEDAARRFAWLVELIYDHRKRLIVSACVRPPQLFAARLSSHGDSADFGKIASRLLEMQSTEYDYSLASEAAG